MASFIEEITTVRKRHVYQEEEEVNIFETEIDFPLKGWAVQDFSEQNVTLIDEHRLLIASVMLESEFNFFFKDRKIISKEKWSFYVFDIETDDIIISNSANSRNECMNELKLFVHRNPVY